jgi:antibiotic biosynthesis monooxygenase (ABM) superfamily enzyme
MWEAILVGLIVLVAILYALWRLSPAGLRLRTAHRIGEWARSPGRPAWLQRASAVVETAARRRAGACSDCSAVQADPAAPTSRKPPRG